MDNNDVLLSLQGISKRFRTSNGFITAARDVSFTVARGEIMAMVGESGSGKRTVGRIVAGLVAPDGGEVVISGETIRAGENDIRVEIKDIKKENNRVVFTKFKENYSTYTVFYPKDDREVEKICVENNHSTIPHNFLLLHL